MRMTPQSVIRTIARVAAGRAAVAIDVRLRPSGRRDCARRSGRRAGVAPGRDGWPCSSTNFATASSVVETVRKLTQLPLETHLMITGPRDTSSVSSRRRRPGDDPRRGDQRRRRPCCEQIRAHGAAAGLAFNPPTPLSAIEHCLPHCDTVLVMSVNPGYGGQAFEPVALEKLPSAARPPGAGAAVGDRRRHS